MRKWIMKKRDDNAVREMCEKFALGELAAGVLASRGITDPDDFLGVRELHDPFLMKDMDKCVEIIGLSLRKGERITIFGDYDCDGVTATVMLYNYLTALGGETDWYIPSREEGYGLNEAAVRKIADMGTRLIITVDNGITALREAEVIKELGIKLIITDHHQPPPVLPIADAIINPHREDDSYPYKELAGCGVVLKLIMALEDNHDSVIEQFGDLAAIGTIGDIVPLTGENRYITEQGLQILPFTENMGLYRLLHSIGFEGGSNISSTSVAFGVCPRINAAGRLTHAREAVELLLSENGEQAAALVKKLSDINASRQAAEADIIRDIEKNLTENPDRLYDRVLICAGEGYHHGIIGIVSSKILDRYNKPNLIISIEGDTARGSARSLEGFPLHSLLAACGDLLIKHGGHARAAGFSLKTALIPEFTARVQKYALEHCPIMPVSEVRVDLEVYDHEITVENVEKLSVLQPFGEGNGSPLFLLRNAVIITKKPLKDGKYLSINIQYGNLEQRIVNFSSTYDDFIYKAGDRVDILVSFEVNEYNNVRSVSARLRDIRAASFPEGKYFAAAAVYEKLRRGEKVETELRKRIIPEKDEIKAVYDILRTTACFTAVRDTALLKGLNYCKLCVILDLFHEFKIAKQSIINNRVELLPKKDKTDFSASEVLARYENCLSK